MPTFWPDFPPPRSIRFSTYGLTVSYPVCSSINHPHLHRKLMPLPQLMTVIDSTPKTADTSFTHTRFNSMRNENVQNLRAYKAL